MFDMVDGKAAQDFEQAMARMSADSEIRAECEEIAAEFSDAEADGLGDDDGDYSGTDLKHPGS